MGLNFKDNNQKFIHNKNITVLRFYFNVGISGGELKFDNIYNVEELNKISEYKIQPIN